MTTKPISIGCTEYQAFIFYPAVALLALFVVFAICFSAIGRDMTRVPSAVVAFLNAPTP